MKVYIGLLASVLSIFFSISSVFAAGTLDRFEVILGKENANVGEALDVTISAVDQNGEILSDYTGDILVFSESDAEAEFPNDLAENSYSFTTADEGTVKFENAIKYQNSGVQDLYVYDLNDDNVLGVAEVTIKEKEILQDVEVTILSPENGITLGKDSLTVSGTTLKNHQVRIVINNGEEIFTTSNGDGIFEKEVEGLSEGTNAIQAFILDADNNKIGESDIVTMKINSSVPSLKNLSVSPGLEVETESEISLEVVSNIALEEVSIMINDIITLLTETKDGVYTGTTLAPQDAGKYGISVILKDEFAHQTQERDVKMLSVTALPELEVAQEEVVETTDVVEEENPDLSIQDIKVVELKSKSVITWKAVPAAEKYNIYKKLESGDIELIESVTESKYEIEIVGEEIKYEDFAIKAIGKNNEGEMIQGDLSEMTKVKTGPELYIMLAIIALLLTSGIFFMRRNHA